MRAFHPFLYRLLMIRTQGAALLVLILALSALFAKRPRWLLVLAFAFTWLYDGFVLILAVAGLYALAVGIVERRLAWRPVVWTAAGIALGLVINPYFPQNVTFILAHLGDKVAFGSGVPVGQEWYPYTTGDLLAHSGGALLILAVGLLRPGFGGRPARQRDTIETTLLLVALLTLFMLFRSRRFIEYYPAFALLFAAAAWGRHPLDVAHWLPARLRGGAGLVRRVALGGVIAFGLFLATTTVLATAQDARSATDPARFAGASAWLVVHTRPARRSSRRIGMTSLACSTTIPTTRIWLAWTRLTSNGPIRSSGQTGSRSPRATGLRPARLSNRIRSCVRSQ